jgi:hypothetical protein
MQSMERALAVGKSRKSLKQLVWSVQPKQDEGGVYVFAREASDGTRCITSARLKQRLDERSARIV